MERIASALAKPLGADVSVQGCTDLAVRAGDRWLKFSGNAQRRRRQAVLFHGTILYAFDLALIAELLRFPSKQPDYRASRSHLDFITNVTAPRDSLITALRTAWSADDLADSLPDEDISTLVATRYGNERWIRRREG
jgi:lipoate-protein ligase A